VIDVEQAFREHAPALVWAVRRRVPGAPPALVEDACGEAWAIAWRYRAEVEPGHEFAWLFVVALHELYALGRKRRREILEGGGQAGMLYAREGDPELALEAREALRAVDRLSPHQRRAIALRAAGFRYDEIQAIEDKTYTWVNRHLSEGTRALRAALADD
jgi:DNA-directed RNA polymerase specialized sigma24 family protein